MNWKKLVEKKNASTFVIPEGWDSRDTIAEQLDCSPEKVRDHLRPAIKSGEVVEQAFKVWSPELGRCVMVTAYRQATHKTSQLQACAKAFDIAKASAMKAKGESYRRIGMAFGMSPDAVRARLRRD